MNAVEPIVRSNRRLKRNYNDLKIVHDRHVTRVNLPSTFITGCSGNSIKPGGSRNKVVEYRHSSDCSTIPRFLKKWKTKSGNLATERWSRHGRVLPGYSAISLLSEVRAVTQKILMASDVMMSSSLCRRLRGSRLL